MFAHEYGHYVANTLDQLNGKGFQNWFIEKCVEKFAEQTREGKRQTYRDLGKAWSVYGATSTHEAFSEYFTEENPSEFSKLFGDLLVKELKKC